ncbi:MAG: ABC transporter substrate-binding protein [Bradyrhizobium sp.]|uniref:ABC transporter substrate-binding protein n=1 Tax=Bradyrhizobium sp. TaxID=376 RepID=UPI001D793A17|nr:ABC transporter substrate-binding protein [Bradyrhizobium sp.]MBV9566040.1 ABC transporter substrate-binding protein [Bradyrhizobium sp.]
MRVVHHLLAATLALLLPAAASAQGPVKIGVLSDMSSLYADITGEGTVAAARMAAEDFGPVLGKPVEVVFADHQNKADVGATIVRRWYDEEGVDMVTDGGSSAVALAVEEMSRQKQKLVLFSGPASSDITGKNCSPYAAHWTYDTYALSHVTGTAVVRSGGKSWFFIGADYAFGRALQRDTSQVVEAEGGKVLGTVYAPLNTPDFSSFLLQAQASKAEVIGLANAGGDATNAIKQGAEFGILKGGQKFAALLFFISDVHAMGLKAAQGLQFTEAFYWDQTPETRAFAERFRKKIGRMPGMVQAGVYSATLHYLKAVKELGSKDPLKVMEKMRETPINDFMTTNGKLRIDGRVERDMYLLEVKTPEESKYDWDYVKVVAKVPGDKAYRPMSDGGCPLVK